MQLLLWICCVAAIAFAPISSLEGATDHQSPKPLRWGAGHSPFSPLPPHLKIFRQGLLTIWMYVVQLWAQADKLAMSSTQLVIFSNAPLTLREVSSSDVIHHPTLDTSPPPAPTPPGKAGQAGGFLEHCSRRAQLMTPSVICRIAALSPCILTALLRYCLQ